MRAARVETAVALAAAALFLWLAVATLHGGLAGFDDAVRADIHALATPWLTASAQLLTWFGAGAVLVPVCGLTALLLIRTGRRSDARLLLFTMAGSVVLENALKFSIQRPRPPPFFGMEPTTYSFPSGHALFSLCFYGALAVMLHRRGAGALAWPATCVLVVLVGATRIYLGVHYPTDVIAGYLVATGWICTVLAIEAHVALVRRSGAHQDPDSKSAI